MARKKTETPELFPVFEETEPGFATGDSDILTEEEAEKVLAEEDETENSDEFSGDESPPEIDYSAESDNDTPVQFAQEIMELAASVPTPEETPDNISGNAEHDGQFEKEKYEHNAESPSEETASGETTALYDEPDFIGPDSPFEIVMSGFGGGVSELSEETEETEPESISSEETEPTELAPPIRAEQTPVATRSRKPKAAKEAPILTIEAHDEVESQADREDAVWHEIRNAYRTRKILTGTLSGIEQLENGNSIVVVYYKEFRVVIPISEMMIPRNDSPELTRAEVTLQRLKIFGTMLGAEIDFIVRGIDVKDRSIVASRKEAMLKKRRLFYLTPDADGNCRVHENRIVQARIISVAEKVVRVEVFGVDCAIFGRDLSWEWIGDAHERFSVGDRILCRVISVRAESIDEISVKVDIKSISNLSERENLKKCRLQSKYAGKVTDIRKGVVFIRLSIGVNAIAHSCLDTRMPGKKDDVSFAVTHIDNEQNLALGIITRIIKQNI